MQPANWAVRNSGVIYAYKYHLGGQTMYGMYIDHVLRVEFDTYDVLISF